MSSLRGWWRSNSSNNSPKASPRSTGFPSPNASSLAVNDKANLSSPTSAPSTQNGSAAASLHGASGSAPLTPAQQELSDIDDAMEAAALIMNDDIDGAQARLQSRNDSSSFHQLGLGIAIFVRSILGFEKDIMSEAAICLNKCEAQAWQDMKRAQKEAERTNGGRGWFGRSASYSGKGNGHVSAKAGNYYPAGSEFDLVRSEAQLMNSVIMVMQESLTEGVKGFYKLRKAFITLDGLMQIETKILKEQAGIVAPGAVGDIEPTPPPLTRGASSGKMPGGFGDDEEDDETPMQEAESARGTDTDSDLEIVDLQAGTPAIEKTLTDLHITESAKPEAVRKPLGSAALASFDPSAQRAATRLFTNQMDIFVHSGVNMCFGILLLLISMVPPAFSKLLYVIGFKGDRVRGLRMMWQSTVFANVNGAVAAMVLLGYYNGMLSFADIVLTREDIEKLQLKTYKSAPGEEAAEDDDDDADEIVGYPRRRCANLLAEMRKQYPQSGLWKLEEARMLANARKLPEAIVALKANDKSNMRQVTALNNFELSIDSMCLLDWTLMSESYIKCIELNDWSHATYYYLAACAEVEMYRDGFVKARGFQSKEGPESAEAKAILEEAIRHKKKAEEWFRKAPTLAGRKKFMSRPVPLEMFVVRKVKKLEERAEKAGVDLVDAIGVSPVMEMMWMWNGSKRMPAETLEKARKILDWERCTGGEKLVEIIKKDEVDEVAIMDLCDATLLRQLKRHKEAKALVQKVVDLPVYVPPFHLITTHPFNLRPIRC
jgi:hypothetical protein